MSKTGTPTQPSRRDLVKLSLLAGTAAAMPWQAVDAQPAAPPRNRTMILTWSGREGRWVDYELWNPYSIGANHQNGPNLIYEPLAYYSAFADKTYMWLAESYEFAPDHKKLTIKTRPGITWSDGHPFSAEDVAYTLNSLRDLGPKVRWGVDVQQAVEKATATDANTVVVDFKLPSPRFFFFMTYKYDIGVYIVPKHIFEGQDWTTFKHFDIAKGWPISTGPWQVTQASPQQKVFDRRKTWWAAERKLAPLPQVERNIWLPFTGEQQTAQLLITNQLDAGTGMQPATFPTLFRQNPKITTHSGQKQPYGYLDWWPISLYINNETKPFDNKDVRWALSNYIDRNLLVEVGYLGANTPSKLPLPPYPPLMPFFDAVKDLLAKYDTNAFDPKKGDALLAGAGFKKNGQGVWADAGGKPIERRHHRLRRLGPGDRPGAGGDVQAPRCRCQPRPAARLRRPLPEGQVPRRHLRPWRLDQRALLHLAPVPGLVDRGARRPSGELRALEERRLRQAGGRDVRGVARQHQEAGRDLSRSHGNLAAGVARYPAGAEHPPHPDEHHLLEELAHRREPVHQRRALAPDLRHGAVEPADRLTAAPGTPKEPQCEPSTWRGASASSC